MNVFKTVVIMTPEMRTTDKISHKICLKAIRDAFFAIRGLQLRDGRSES